MCNTSDSISATVTSVKPASASIEVANCLPHTVPNPAPSSASDTVMQCISEVVYR
ncbi:Uncharacterised protein [Mycobacterium tuberculosis]|nr:Uncharacterised protein [Mycobacterium tuberculosis]